MKKWKARCKGVISVFLIIVLVSNYALIGVLVDAARQRMARAHAEMALDTAAASVLSYYNQMVFDLYGLFATDSLSEDEIKTLLTEYTEKTLGIIPVSESETTALTNAIVNTIPYFQNDDLDGILFDGYHYNIDVEADSSLTTSLANTDAVEAQIIDHMKYKAPAAMLEGMGNFLENLNAVLTIKDRVEQTIEKVKTTKEDKEALCQKANLMLERIKMFNARVLNFSQTAKLDSPGSGSAYDPWKLVDDFDKKLEEIAATYNYEDETKDEATVAALQKAYDDAVGELREKLDDISAQGEALLNEANAIRDDVEALDKEFEQYIAKLQAKLDADKDNENLKTLYLPEIELAKSTMGEVLKNMDLVLNGRQYSNNLRSYFADYEPSFISSASSVVNKRMGGAQGPATMRSMIYNGELYDIHGHPEYTKMLLDDMKRDFSELFEIATSFRKIEAPTLEKEDVAPKNVDEKKAEKDAKTEGLRNLVEEDLAVDFAAIKSPEWNTGVGDLGTEDPTALLTAGLNLLKAIEGFLEGARDSLYINEYIIAYFPNYVQHYNAADSDFAKNHSNKRLIDSNDYYAKFNASQAELEYVLIGNSNAALNVAGVSAYLTGVRMMFNTVAIFTDSAKVQQANMIAAAAGPFAPLVATALLLAWALGESVLDTIDLMNGAVKKDDASDKKGLVFKQGKDWQISLEGAVESAAKEVLGKVGDAVENALNEKLDAMADSAKSVANTIIYDAYQKIESGTQQALDTAQNELDKWSESIGSSIPNGAGTPFVNTSGAIQSAVGSIGSAATQLEGQARDQALLAINKGVDKVNESIQNKSAELISKGEDYLTDAVSKKLAGSFEVGNVKETGSGDHGMFKVKFDYLDYMRIFLLFSKRETRVQRLQQLIQANIRYGSGSDDFSMAGSYVSLGATLTGDIDFLFMTNAILPEELKQNGRLKFTVSTSMSY